MKLMNKRLTYFTPTYNREHDLPRLYESLVKQTNKDFIWLVIDDGSTDKTRKLVEKWTKDNIIEIEYVYKKNGGKNTAIDLSNQLCKTEYINCIDSDDYIALNSTEVLYKYLDIVSQDKKLCGIVGRKKIISQNEKDTFPTNKEKLYFKELKTKYCYTEETNLVFKTEIVKRFHFPEIKNEKFITESVFYNQFLFDYKMLAIPEELYFFEYRDDGYTKQGMDLFFKNPEGYLYYLKQSTYYAIKNKEPLKKRLYYAHIFYAWKKSLKLNEKYPNDYKLPFFYRILGKLLSLRLVFKYKRMYKEFKNGDGRK